MVIYLIKYCFPTPFLKNIMTQRLGLPNHEIQTRWAFLLWGKMQKTIPDYAHNDLPRIKDFLKQNKRPLHLAKNYSMLHLAKRNSGESPPKKMWRKWYFPAHYTSCKTWLGGGGLVFTSLRYMQMALFRSIGGVAVED